MNTRTLRASVVLSAVTAGMIAVGFAVPAIATPDESTAHLTVEAGSLNISVAQESANLGNIVDSVDGSTVTNPLGKVSVTDARGEGVDGASDWVAEASSSNFVPAGGGTPIAASGVGYDAVTATATGPGKASQGFDITKHANIAAAQIVVKTTGVTQNNAATWTPDLSVKIPAGTVADTYTGTITHSVA